MLWRYDGNRAPSAVHRFRDITRGYQGDAVSRMAEREITTGTSPTTFDPDGYVTRAQAATFMYRYVGEPLPGAAVTTADCLRELRLALIVGGLTPAEAACAAPYLTDWSVDYLLAIVSGEIDPTLDFDLLATVALIAPRCLTPERVSDLSRLFL